MYLLSLAVLLSLLRYFEVGPFANLGWAWIIAVYVATALWWSWSDWSGYTARRAQERMDRRKAERLGRQRDQLGVASSKTRKR
jgi:small Trp-rich protein